MTATTSPDALPYPNDYEQPADSPSAFQALANATQAALNKRMNILNVGTTVPLATGWQPKAGWQPWAIWKTGRICTAVGLIERISNLAVTDNTPTSVIATLPAGIRPISTIRVAAPWSVLDSGSVRQNTMGQLTISIGGDIVLIPNLTGTMAPGDFVSIGGLSWISDS